MRRIIRVPIIHTAADLGSLAETVRARYLRELGPLAWEHREQIVEALWNDIRQRIDGLRLDFHKVAIYQDGLPVCGHEVEIVRELAGAGSRNHQLLLNLAHQGATVMGTEDPQLLIREYQLHRRGLASHDTHNAPTPSAANEAEEVLRLRDDYIARRIADTLDEGQTALIFLGAAHRLEAQLPTNLPVEVLL